MNINNTTMWSYVVLSLTTIGILLIFLIRCGRKHNEHYCLCQGNGGKVCQPDMTKLYDGGNTESKKQVRKGGWNYPSPGDCAFPGPENSCDQQYSHLASLV